MTPNPLETLAGAAGFEPADAGTKNHYPLSKLLILQGPMPVTDPICPVIRVQFGGFGTT
jgi:hypothetical protein